MKKPSPCPTIIGHPHPHPQPQLPKSVVYCPECKMQKDQYHPMNTKGTLFICLKCRNVFKLTVVKDVTKSYQTFRESADAYEEANK